MLCGVAHDPSSAEILVFIIVNNLHLHLEPLKLAAIMTEMLEAFLKLDK